jgi:DNA modification methylase
MTQDKVATKQFAPQYSRTPEGWVLFPHDVSYRKRLFPDQVFEHPAKAQLYLLEAITEYVSEPGETILDPFGGTGSMLVATLKNRNVIMCEVEPHFVDLINQSINKIQEHLDYKGGIMIVIPGDNRQTLPIPCDHVITSPPYSNILSGTGLKQDIGRSNTDAAMTKYSGENASPLNIGRLSQFLYSQHMVKVYSLLFQSIRPGGTLTILIKDRMRQGKRDLLSDACIRACVEAGFELKDWFKWKAPGTAQQKLMQSKGFDTVEDEDIIILRRP